MKYELDNMPCVPPEGFSLRKIRGAPAEEKSEENESPRTGRTVQRRVSVIDQA